MESGSRSDGSSVRAEFLSSSESRWVDGSEVEEEDELVMHTSEHGRPESGDDGHKNSLASKKMNKVDSLLVQALDVHGSHSHHRPENQTLGVTLRLAFQTLGVVYGDMGTSPLYVFSSVFAQSPIEEDDDILGALSLVLYTIALIPLAKYVFIVLKANDNGEGGTFSLYSLICRYAKVNMLPNHEISDEKISSYKLKVPSSEFQRSLKIKEALEKISMLKTILLLLVLMGTSMVIGDGILTPAMSVMSAVSGLKDQIPSFTQDAVVIISIVFLVLLFSIQQYGTSKVGLSFAPALSIWFFSLGSIGIYNIVTYDMRVFKAVNPLYIINFFQRNNIKAWMSLGGCVLCITGAEAMFADLGHFSVRSIQIAFTFVVFPCLVLAYMGQAAFLMKNPAMADKAFYASIPDGLFWAVFVIATVAAMIASQAMISATFSCIKQAMALGCFPRLKIIHTSKRFVGQIYIPVINWFLMAMCIIVCATFRSTTEISNAYGIAEVCVMLVTTSLVTLVMILIWQTHILYAIGFFIFFGAIELTYFSAVVVKIKEGGWLPLAFATFFLLTMYIWNYGSVLRYQSEVKKRLSMDFMLELGSDLGTIRVPGIGLVFSELARGVPAVFGHFLTSLPAMYSTIVLVCIKYVPVPIVPKSERFIFRRVCPKDYNMFKCVARYGYKDIRKENAQDFENLLIESLENFLLKEAMELALETPHEQDFHSKEAGPSDVCSHSFTAPLTADCRDTYHGASTSSALQSSIMVPGDDPRIDSLTAPLMADYRDTYHGALRSTFPSSIMIPGEDLRIEYQLASLHDAKDARVVYLVGHGDVKADKKSLFIKKLAINYFYAFLRKNCRASVANLNVPHTNLLRVRMTYVV